MAERPTEETVGIFHEITGATQLHRHLVADWVVNGRITSQGFVPIRKDDNKLSLAHGGMVSPAESQRLHRGRGYRSDAVATITGSDCTQVGLKPIHDADSWPEHVSLPFAPELSNKSKRDIGRRLAGAANLTVPLASAEPPGEQ